MPLDGKRILVTRGADQAGALCTLIRARSGIPVVFPTVRLVPPGDPAPLDAALAALSSFDGVLFTSANAVRFFCERAALRGIAGLPEGILAASVGPGTSRALRECGFPVHVEAAVHTAEGLVEALGARGIAGRRFLFPRAKEGRAVVPEAIGKRGGSVTAVVAYENGLPVRDEEAAGALAAHPPDVCTFASPSAFRNFFRLLGEERAAAVLARSRIAVIGEVTARAVAARGLAVDIAPGTYTIPAMVEAIATAFADDAGREGMRTR